MNYGIVLIFKFKFTFSNQLPIMPYNKQKSNIQVIYLLLIIITTCLPDNASGHHFKDTIRFRRSIAEKTSLRLSDSTLNEIGLDSLLSKVENVHNTLNYINNATATGFDTRSIEDNFPAIDSNVDIIDGNISLYNSVLDVKNLQMFNVLLSDLQDQLTDWRTLLFKYSKQLNDMNDQMNTFRKDTVLRSLLADSSFRSLYQVEINDLKSKWGIAKKSIADSKSHLNQWQSIVSNEYFETIDLQNKIKNTLRKISFKSLGKEYDFLWNVNSRTIGETKETHDLVRKSYRGQRRILHYYFIRNWDNQFWMLLVGIIFILWVFKNFSWLQKRQATDLQQPAFKYIKRLSLLATLVMLFNIAPLFDIHPPTAYVEIIEFFLVISVTFLLFRNWPKDLYKYWLLISALYIVFSFTGTFLTPGIGFRLFLFALNVAGILWGVLWLKKLRKHKLTFQVMIKIVSAIFIALNIGAALCNLFGRLSIAKIFSITAIYGLTQIIGLSLFIEILVEAFRLQTTVIKFKGGLSAKLDYDRLEQLIKRGLMALSIIIWIIVFTISLNIYNVLYNETIDFLNKPRKIGSTSFEIGNLLLFIVIIYVSNVLQQGIGSLYGRNKTNWDPEIKKNGSRLAMTRLIFIILAFLIAIAASGLPLDKITIVLGALGVGIGLGLQAIVNNLVSGVILIFEQPFRIGDYIEIGDKRGRVLDIGIRSSKLIMEEGAEIIMPNADLLSGRVINWSTHNDNVRIDFPISIEPGHPFEEVKQIILEELNKNELILKTLPPEILFGSLTEKAMIISVLVWINDVHRIQNTRSELLNDIYTTLATKGIKVA